jgi:rubrerythrin
MLFVRAATLTSEEDLKTSLQNAIRLEHATIPPYLTAYYTLSGNTDSVKYARGIIRDIIVEEMLHLTLAANILIAVGGSPKLNDPLLVPKYPGPLPMGIGDDDGPAPGQPLQVGLEPYSKKLVETVFMAIEEPEDPIEIPDVRAEAVAAGEPTFQTIGQFYATVKAAIDNLGGDALFKKADPALQVLGWFGPTEEIPITDAASAKHAIDVIVQQGEGTPKKPIDLQGDVPHFYRFQELFLGKKLVEAPGTDLGIAYDPNQPIVIEAGDVVAMAPNPGLIDLSGDANARARRLSDECDAIYSKLLNALQIAFNGQPNKMGDALGVMFELKNAAEELMQQRIVGGGGNGLFAGPRFLYVPS